MIVSASCSRRATSVQSQPNNRPKPTPPTISQTKLAAACVPLNMPVTVAATANL